MSNVHPLVAPLDDRPSATVAPLDANGARASWLDRCERAWADAQDEPAHDPAAPDGARATLVADARSVRARAQEVGDEFVVAAADVVLLRELVRAGRFGEAIAGLVPAIADLETYPASPWVGRAHGTLAAAFARLGETEGAVEHFRAQQLVGEELQDLELQADAVSAIASLTPTSPERLDAFAAAEALYARASVEQERAVVGGIRARLNRSFTNVDLGLVTAAVDQLPYVVELAGSLDLPGQADLAVALQARCAALGGDTRAGLEGAAEALDRAESLPTDERQAVAVECATTFLACDRPDLVVEALEAPATRKDSDLARREQALDLLAEAYHRTGDARAAFDTLREAERIGTARLRLQADARLDAMRTYHRTQADERALADQRDISARLFEQVGHLGERGEGISEVAIRDEVTGLPNRRYLDLELRWRCSQRLPGRGVLGLAVVTIDRFADLVAALGQDEGDRLAVMVAQIVSGNVRSGDAVARVAEDGFAVIQFHRAPDSARFAGERLRAAVADFAWSQHGFDRPITASVGVAALVPPAAPGALVARAGAASAQVCADGGDGVRLAEH